MKNIIIALTLGLVLAIVLGLVLAGAAWAEEISYECLHTEDNNMQSSVVISTEAMNGVAWTNTNDINYLVNCINRMKNQTNKYQAIRIQIVPATQILGGTSTVYMSAFFEIKEIPKPKKTN